MQRAARSLLRRAARALPARFFRAAPPVLAADKESLLQLRRRTGLPFLQCREALLRCGGDLQRAEAWLQEEARQRGWSRVTAPGARPAREGLVGLLRDGPAAAMVEVNCETDFVARTAEFRRVVELAALSTMAHCREAAAHPAPCTTHLLHPDELDQLRSGPGTELLSDQLARAAGQLGEKVALRRAGWLRVPEPGGLVATYTHGRELGEAEGAVATGMCGAMVGCGVPEPLPPRAELEALGRGLAQHVVGMAPTALGEPGDEPRGEDEPRLLAQSFLLEPALTVGQFLAARGGLAVRGFLRFRCGEDPPVDPPAG